MNSGVAERTSPGEDCLDNSEELSPLEGADSEHTMSKGSPPLPSSPWWNSKRLHLDDSCNNNLNSTLNSASKNNENWTCSDERSLEGSHILEEMGVRMLGDITVSVLGGVGYKKTKKFRSSDYVTSSTDLDNSKQDEKVNRFDSQESIYRGSSFETVSLDSSDGTRRLEQDSCELDEAAPYSTTGNESGYSSRVEIENLIDTKENFTKESLGVSDVKINLNDFYICRKRRKPVVVGEDKFNRLSDEIILMILKWLPKKCLVRSMLVCKRWCQIARDEALWTRLDLGGKVLTDGTLGHILPRGVQILRLAQAEIANPIFLGSSAVFTEGYVSKLQYLDMSMAVITPNALAMLLSKCRYLKKLSLEKCAVNRACCKAISENTDLDILNLTMCEGLDAECVKDIIKLPNLNALNMSWCNLDADATSILCKGIPLSVTRLNIAGCRKTMTDEHVKDLVRRCPGTLELDLSDCTMLTMNTVRSILKLTKLEHLSLSRCYGIPPSTYITLAYMPSLLYLDVFGLVAEPVLKTLQVTCGETQLNKYLYSSVARPTVGVRRTSIWGLRVRD